jgi:hypothetical protein
VSWSSPTTKIHYVNPTAEQKANGWTQGHDFWPRLDRILSTGLAHWVPHVMESDGPEAEPILALRRELTGMGVPGDSLEERIWWAAYDASHALLHEGARARAEELDLTYLPLANTWPSAIGTETPDGPERDRGGPRSGWRRGSGASTR